MALLITAVSITGGHYLLKLFIDGNAGYGSAALQVAELYLFVSAIFLVILFPIHTFLSPRKSRWIFSVEIGKITKKN
jgi:hypothetical protein